MFILILVDHVVTNVPDQRAMVEKNLLLDVPMMKELRDNRMIYHFIVSVY